MDKVSDHGAFCFGGNKGIDPGCTASELGEKHRSCVWYFTKSPLGVYGAVKYCNYRRICLSLGVCAPLRFVLYGACNDCRGRYW